MNDLTKAAIRVAICFAPYFAIVWTAFAVGGSDVAVNFMFWAFAAVIFASVIVGFGEFEIGNK